MSRLHDYRDDLREKGVEAFKQQEDQKANAIREMVEKVREMADELGALKNEM